MNKVKCNHIIGLATINDEDDEFVVVEQGDSISFDAGDNTAFDYCPKCGEFLDPIVNRTKDSKMNELTKTDIIIDGLMSDVNEYDMNIRNILAHGLESNPQLKQDYIEWFTKNKSK